MTVRKISAVFCAFLLVFCVVGSAGAATENRVTVEATGSGPTKLAALKEAWTEAVRKAVGMYMTTKTETLNDELTEQIAAYSRGQVNSFETLSETQDNGIWIIKIRANVDRDIMNEIAAPATRQAVKVDGASLAAQMQTSKDQKKDALEILKTSTLFDFSKCLEYSAQLKKVDLDGQTYFFMQNTIKMNLKNFRQQENELEKLVATLATSKRNMRFDQPAVKQYLARMNQDIDVLNNFVQNRKENFSRVMKQSNRGKLNGIAIFAPWRAWSYDYGAYEPSGQIIDNKVPDLTNDNQQDEICFMKNSANAVCYGVSPEIKNAIYDKSVVTIQFDVESENEFDNNVATSPEIYIFFAHNSRGRSLIFSPILSVSETVNKVPDTRNKVLCSVFIYDIFLNLSVEELAETGNLTGKFVIDPYKVNK